MNKEVVKQAYAEAEKEARDKQVAEVKLIIKKTLEKLSTIRKQIKDLQEEEKILKLDIDDIKDGHLDRIEERQRLDKKAKEVSVVTIIKELEVIREVNPWYTPYKVIWSLPQTIPAYNNGLFCTTGSGNSLGLTLTTSSNYCSINSSVAKDGAIGAYDINGSIVNLR